MDDLVRIAGDDDRKLAVVIGHGLDEFGDRLLAEVVVVEAVRLVDEQHPAERPADGLGGAFGGAADVLLDQVLGRDLDQVAGGEQPLLPVDAGNQPRQGGLAGAGATEQGQVQVGQVIGAGRPDRGEPVDVVRAARFWRRAGAGQALAGEVHQGLEFALHLVGQARDLAEGLPLVGDGWFRTVLRHDLMGQ